LFEFHDKIDII